MSDVTQVRGRKYLEISSEETLPPGELHKPAPRGIDKKTTIRSEETLGPRHFTDAEAADLDRTEGTNQVLRRDLGVRVDVHGRDKTQRELSAEHHAHVGVDGFGGLVEVVADGAGIAGAHLPLALDVASPFVALGLGFYELHAAHAQGAEQAEAVTRENVHVGLLGALNLPPGFKDARFKELPGVSRGPNTEAFRMTERLMSDPKGLAALQHRADIGMIAGRDFADAGVSKEAFLAAHPKIRASYADDAAFREGFDAYVFARDPKNGVDVRALDARLDGANAWTTQAEVNVRG
ncbi:MAG: hypothetical protein KIT84_19450 [Labilithrix sp.]|nr:hypothetical protein [Labilithrix sp.]MCW5813212.1 hypothetical protein [Labilithrix sp.]